MQEKMDSSLRWKDKFMGGRCPHLLQRSTRTPFDFAQDKGLWKIYSDRFDQTDIAFGPDFAAVVLQSMLVIFLSQFFAVYLAGLKLHNKF